MTIGFRHCVWPLRSTSIWRVIRLAIFVSLGLLLYQLLMSEGVATPWPASSGLLTERPERQSLDNVLFPKTPCLTTRPAESTVQRTNGNWQAFREENYEILVSSAFYDDRTIVGQLPVVRIMAVATTSLPDNKHLFCQVWYEGREHPLVANLTIIKTGMRDSYGYGQYMYSCQLMTNVIRPSHVSVTGDECQASTIYMPVVVPSGPYKHEFGLCVNGAYGLFDFVHFAEWMEIHKMLGVTEINIYNTTLKNDANLYAVFGHYMKEGTLRLHQMPPPIDRYDLWASRLSSPASLNDCMYRNMYRYRLMVVVDVDEVIVPRQDQNYAKLIQHIDRMFNLTESWWSYTFLNLYYFRDKEFAPNVSSTSDIAGLWTLRYRNRVKKPEGPLVHVKSMVDPRRCLSVFNHYCLKRFPSTPQGHPGFTIHVPPELGMSHHYRYCPAEKKCSELFSEKTADDFMLKYRDELSGRVGEALAKAGIKPGQEVQQQ